MRDHYFSTWSGPMAYILGYLFADGSIYRTKTGGRYLSIQTKDRNVLQFIKRELQAHQKIERRYGHTGPISRLQIGNRTLYEGLEALGYIERKTARMRLPRAPKRYLADFVRGYFDGDGNVWIGAVNRSRKHPIRVCFTSFTSASRGFLHDLWKALEPLNVKGSLFPIKGSNAWRINFSTRDSLKIADFMYNTATAFSLLRKKRTFKRYTRW